MTNFIKIISAVALAGTLTATASAQGVSAISVNEEGYRTVEVTYSDLNLSTAEGQKAMANRVRIAVRRVCGGPAMRPTLAGSESYRSCANRAMQNALASLDKQTKVRLALNF